ncbi:hypothetical protein [Longimicrobium sp.]|uniref:hypothetical protein n=1 Tax=Longimicrobium sp. TaxID=2029185 RepID=UPI002D06B513|nr:hypothetical protein [Longimicrobium sp.]HSU17326.1 hypothetical protein [Longimicrobium sp.]
MRRAPVSLLLVAGLALLVHVDWHLARSGHGHHRLSFDWPYHWTLAVPAFALAAWVVWRRWPDRLAPASALNLGLALAVGQVLEPLAEQIHYFHRFALGIEPPRWTVFLQFAGTGLLAYACTLALLHRRARRDPSRAPVRPA